MLRPICSTRQASVLYILRTVNNRIIIIIIIIITIIIIIIIIIIINIIIIIIIITRTMQGNSDSGIRPIFVCGILGSRIRKTAQAIRNPINDWNPETTPCGIQNPRLSWIPRLLSWSAVFGIYTQELVNLVLSNQISFLKQSVYSVSINKRKHF